MNNNAPEVNEMIMSANAMAEITKMQYIALRQAGFSKKDAKFFTAELIKMYASPSQIPNAGFMR